MLSGDVLILKGDEVSALLAGQERAIIQTVRAAYEAHAAGSSSLPHSTFLRFPDEPRNRIIALPAYLGADFELAGMKWISSFPRNLERGQERASAVVVLNSSLTGRPFSVMEGSIISAKRTAASAALAAVWLSQRRMTQRLGLIGCGVINHEILRFLLSADLEIQRQVTIFDIDPERAHQFEQKCRRLSGDLEIEIAPDVEALLARCMLVSFATTALKPYLSDLSNCPAGSTLLHISLRDLTPEAILACDNVVDDVSHVCRAETSVNLAEQLAGHRNFIRCTLAEVTSGSAPARSSPERRVAFSPFGLGVLDLAVGKLVYDLGIKHHLGTRIESFLPGSWVSEEQAVHA